MRLQAAVVLTSTLGLAAAGCSDVPSYWSGLGVTAEGGKVMKTIGASDTFLVINYERPVSELNKTCKDAYAPIVAKGWKPLVPHPDGDLGQKFDQILENGSDKIGITCMVLATEKKDLSVTFSHR
jgi:hypothetical protein